MTMKSEISQALDHLSKAQEIIQNYLVCPITGSPKEIRREMTRRLQAAEHVDEAAAWIKRLDPSFAVGAS
jgi:hypothetical protein